MIGNDEKYSLELEIYGLKVLVESESNNIIEYIKNNLFAFSKTDPDTFDLIVHVQHIGMPYETVELPDELAYFGSEIYFGKGKTVYRTNTLHVETAWKEGVLEVLVKKKLRWDQYLRRTLRIKGDFYLNMLQEIYRFGVEYPVFALLNNRFGFSVIHASGVLDSEDNAILFFGLNGAGKSTFLSDMINKGYRPISDNFLLLKDGNVYAFPGLRKIAKTSRPNGAEIIGTAFNKTLVRENYIVSAGGFNVARVNIISRTNGNTTIEPIGKERALWFLKTMGNYLKEYESYHYTAFIEKDKDEIANNNYFQLAKAADFCVIERNLKEGFYDTEFL